MKKNNLNFIIDAVMFAFMMAIIGIGLLIKYILVHGEKRWELYGSNPDMYVLGLDRHQWGTLHLYLGIALTILLILHIVFHWKQITCIFSRLILHSKTRITLTLLFSGISLFLVIFPWLLPVQIKAIEHGRGQGQHSVHSEQVQKNESVPVHKENEHFEQSPHKKNINESATQKATSSEMPHEHSSNEHEHHTERDTGIQVNGQMTLAQICSQYNIPENVLIDKLGLPTNISTRERLGRLRREYNFRMSTVIEIITDYKTAQ